MSAGESRITVLLVDDHAVVRAGYRRLLEGSAGIEVTGEAADVEAALSLVVALRPDVVVLDLSMPSGSGLEVLRRLNSRPDAPRVLMFSMYEDPVYAEQSLKAGAQGYLTKAGGPSELVDAVRSVARGETWLDPRIARVLALRGLVAPAPVGSQLSTRETEVLRLLVRGRSLREIAATLGISAKTAANHQSAIRQKLGADSAVKLLQVAARLGVG
jgi:two-component system invasion response regulator UvrY